MAKIKKILLSALTVCCILCFGFGCGSRGDNGNSSSVDVSSSASSEEISSSEEESSSEESSNSNESTESEHVCITDGTWKFSTTGHWLKCDCGKNVHYASHYSENKKCEEKPICDVCGVEYGTAPGHSYGELSDGDAGKAYYCKCGDHITNADLVDFVLPVESGKDPVVLQLSDTQLTNSANAEEYCYRYVRDVVQQTSPDLIIITGDVVYGRFDPNGYILKDIIAFMDSLNIPWAPVFGNHDNESLKGVDWQCQQLENAKNCLFKQGDLTGNGNYSIGLERDGELIRVFYMMDSNGCGKPMCDSNGVQTKPDAGTNVVQTGEGFGSDQVSWFTNSVNAIHAVDGDVKISMAYHIQQSIFSTAFRKYDEYNGLTSSGNILYDPLNLDTLETADDTDFGYLGRAMKGGWTNSSLSINNLKNLGVDSIFVGHEHCNSVSIVYEGIRFQYGQKSSQYDRYNSTKNGEIYGGYIAEHPSGATALMGGTVIPVSAEDGSIGTGYICYYGDPFGTESEEIDPIVVNGVPVINPESNVTLTKEAFDESINAYKAVAVAQGKVFIDPALVANKTTFTFTAYVAEEIDSWAWLIRLKPNDGFTNLTQDGKHILYQHSSSAPDHRRVVAGTWQTFSVDISAFGTTCTEFSFIVPAGQTLWIRDITIV